MHMRIFHNARRTGSPLPTLLVLLAGLLLLAGLVLLGTLVYNRVMTAATGRNPVVPVFSPDGAQLAILVGQRTELYDTASYTPRLRLSAAAGGTEAGMAFSPDGSLLHVNRGSWETAGGAPRYSLASAEAFRVVFSSDGRQLATFSFDGVYLFDATNGAQLLRMPTASGCACQTALAFTQPGELVSAAIDGVKTWRLSDGQQQSVWKRDGFSTGMAFSQDGRLLAISDKNQVELWDVAAGQLIRAFDPAPDVVSLLSFSADGNLLVGDSSGPSAAAVMWDVSTGKALYTFNLPARAAGLAFAPDAPRLAVGAYDGQVRLYDLTTGALVHTINDFIDWPALIKSALTP